MKYFALPLGVFFAVSVFEACGYSNEIFLRNWNCIAESGDDDLCNEFQDCVKLAPECYNLPYYYCMKKILPNGVGRCSETEQAYGSEKQRIEINNCYKEIATPPSGDDWTTTADLAPFMGCVGYLGEECQARKSGESSSSESSGSSSSGSNRSSGSGSSGSGSSGSSGSSSSGSSGSSSSGSSESRGSRNKSGSGEHNKSKGGKHHKSKENKHSKSRSSEHSK